MKIEDFLYLIFWLINWIIDGIILEFNECFVEDRIILCWLKLGFFVNKFEWKFCVNLDDWDIFYDVIFYFFFLYILSGDR